MNSLEVAMLIHEVNDFFTLVNREKMVHYTWKKKCIYSYVTNFERRSRAMKHYESYQIKKNPVFIYPSELKKADKKSNHRSIICG